MSKKAEKPVLLLESITGEEKTANLKPMDRAGGFDIRPGFYENNGAFAIPGGVNFTISSQGAISCELLLFHRKSPEPFAVIPFPPHYRIGTVFSMIVFGLKIDEFEYAYRLDGPYDPEKGLLFDKKRIFWIPMPGRLRDRANGASIQKARSPTAIKPEWCGTTLTGAL